MKINGLIFLIVVLGMFMLPIALAQEATTGLPEVCIKGTKANGVPIYNTNSCVDKVCTEPSDQSLISAYAQKCIVAKVEQIANLITLIAGVLGVLAIVITGIMMAMSDDPESRNKLKDKLKYIIFGLILIFAAKFIVAIILG